MQKKKIIPAEEMQDIEKMTNAFFSLSKSEQVHAYGIITGIRLARDIKTQNDTLQSNTA